MRRLIWGFAGRTYHIVGNLMHWLKFYDIQIIAFYCTYKISMISSILFIYKKMRFSHSYNTTHLPYNTIKEKLVELCK